MADDRTLQVRMLGDFTLCTPSARVSDGDNRSKKVWLFLAYLISRRGEAVEAGEYIDLLWAGEARSTNPANALKTILHRARAALEPLWPNAGRELILREGTAYRWNTEIPLWLDLDEFDRLGRAGDGEGGPEERLKLCLAALELYRGDFLPRLSSHPWVKPIAESYHRSYLALVLRTVPLLEETHRYQEAAEVCRAALALAPYEEELYRRRMEALIRLGKQREAAAVYEELSKLFMARLGAMPGEETRTVYRRALSELQDRALPVDAVLEQLREPDGPGGALFCPYDTFRSIYHLVARSLARSGGSVHLALLSVHHKDCAQALSRRSLDRAMDNLQEVIRSSLRRGDAATRCSVSQFLLLLPQASFENSQTVCDRILRAFARKYPHSPACPRSAVFPLEPN